MKKRIFILLTIALLSLGLYMNESFKIDYDVNLLEYISYSREYSDTEKAILNKHAPLIFGGNFFEPPLGKFYEDSNQYVGYMVDYTNALSIELETDIITKPMIWTEALESLKNGETDICDMVPSEERSQYYAFSDRLYDLNGIVLIKKEQEGIQTLDDLKGMRIAVQAGDYIIERFNEFAFPPEIIPADNLFIALELLNNNNVDAIAGDDIVIKALISDPVYNDRYTILNKSVYESIGVIAVPKERAELIPIINKGIFKLKKTGIDQRIETKWFGMTEDASYEKMKRMIILAFVYLLIGIFLVAEWNRSIIHLVDLKTRELRETTLELNNVIEHIRSSLLVLDEKETVVKSNVSNKVEEQVIIYRIKCALGAYDYELSTIHEYKTIDFEQEGRYYSCQIIPFEKEDNKKLIILTDMTKEKLQERKINHTSKMEAVGRLAAGVAHEVRNPLGIIRNSTFLLKDGVLTESELLNITGVIDEAVNRTNRIVENLLEYSRENEGVISHIPLKRFIEDTIVFYKTTLKKKGTKIILDIPDDLTLRVNKTSLRHILINLIANAIDAESRLISITCDISNQLISLMIIDDGKGMTDEILERAFDPFFTTKPIGEGTGLGLYIVYNEVQKINGEISLESEMGVGTRFLIMLKRGEV